MTATPPIVDRETWQKQIDTQRVREKAHTREGTRLPRLAGGCRWSRSTRRRRWSAPPARSRSFAIGTLVERTTGGVRSREHGLQSVDQTRQLTLSPSADFPFATWQLSEPAC